MGASFALLGAAEDPLVFSKMDGGAALLAPGEDEAIVIHFWATWCPSCREEFPVLNAAVQGCEDAKVRLVAVNVGDEPEEIRSFQEEVPIAMPILRDSEGEVWRRVSGVGFPSNLFWTGEERRVEVGALGPLDWRKALDEMGCAAPR